LEWEKEKNESSGAFFIREKKCSRVQAAPGERKKLTCAGAQLKERVGGERWNEGEQLANNGLFATTVYRGSIKNREWRKA